MKKKKIREIKTKGRNNYLKVESNLCFLHYMARNK